VCADVPEQIYTIPSSHPYHNVTYVYVYDSTPDVVTVGYTSGYEGAYVANGLVMFGAGMALGYALFDDDWDDWYAWHYPPCYYSYGCAARFDYHYGGFVRAGRYYGPYAGAGFGARYNPFTGTYARGAFAYGPYRSAGVGSAYNPLTGVHARAGYYSGPGGTRAAGRVYNPRTGRGAATDQLRTPYGSWGRSVISDGEDWARFGHRSGPRGTTVGARTSEGAAGVVHRGRYGWTYAGKTKSGDVYAGRGGHIYRRNESGDWQRHLNKTRNWQATGTRAYDQSRERLRPERWDSSPRTRRSAGDERARVGGAAERLNRDSWSRARGNRLSSSDRSLRGRGMRGGGRGRRR
jgi:hypothetical protein